ncbi:hypothetical protein BBO99_00007279 [Phytophthora kernoviae]|uniref:Protein kinase domain-containing protein n=2 Tax=Phytophthora kernoviae TaxID=325452 RepID=A0A3R7KH04_9STRA|nr:hypothetical protein G195_010832 [Phytophthora kernoviae 00238/432]KAG2514210.1 hypothetical protein JM18_007083 [Phytophthora kernoviae]KAG2515444.1 hypothetical protein JM16_007398 [Phytophthora kernoviae]RLM96087.1 hypothetical protein BBI17_001716 [Phytophthora kernoviae]RLN76773.1 hypothetical protein BBO99_00007279 [Phytophthora kernoviae]
MSSSASPWCLFLVLASVMALASQAAALAPPVCMNSGGLWGGGTLLSECSGNCDDGVLCDVSVNGQYSCLNYTDSVFVLLIQNSGYVSDEDGAARVADASYMTKVSELPNDTGIYPHIQNCYLYDVAELKIDSHVTQFVLTGGDTFRAFYKGRVGYINFNSDFIAKQSQITDVSLVSLNLEGILTDLPSKLPANVVQLNLKNDLIYEFPIQFSTLSMLEELSLEGNYITTLNASDVIPTLKTLNLASNNLTVMPASLTSHENLENFFWRRHRRVAKFIMAELDDPQLAPLMLKPGDIKDIQKIGSGAHSVVWLVRYRKSQLLASKRLRKESRRQITKAFIEEIKLVAPIDHPHIIKLVGIAWTVRTDIQALFEYVDNGSVSEYLMNPSTPREWDQQKLKVALDVSEALVYLHSFAPPILHRDLRASNVLLTSSMEAKLAKTGVAHLRTAQGDETPRNTMGPWQAPEILMGAEEHSPAVDIFSFGVLLSELDTHAAPYNDARSLSGTKLADAVILQMIAAGAIALRFGEGCPPDLRSLADLCLAKNPRARPAASEVVYALRTIRKMM